MDKVKRFDQQPNHLLNLVQAAHILGYKDYRLVQELIEKDFLKGYYIGESRRLKVYYHDLMAFPKKEKKKL